MDIRDNLTHCAFTREDGREVIWNLQHHLKEILGLPPKLPSEGREAVLVGNVWVYVMGRDEAQRNTPRSRRPHRIIAVCPRCNKHIPAGRLHQHLGTRGCARVCEDCSAPVNDCDSCYESDCDCNLAGHRAR
jgi:hypothetical protein